MAEMSWKSLSREWPFYNILFWSWLKGLSPQIRKVSVENPDSVALTRVAAPSPQTCTVCAGRWGCAGVVGGRDGEQALQSCHQRKNNGLVWALPEGPRGGDSLLGLRGRVCPGKKPQGVQSQPPLAHFLTTPQWRPWAPGRWQEWLLGSPSRPTWPGSLLPYFLLCPRPGSSAPGRILYCVQVA